MYFLLDHHAWVMGLNNNPSRPGQQSRLRTCQCRAPHSRLLSLQPSGHATRDARHGGTSTLHRTRDGSDTVAAHGRALQVSKGTPCGDARSHTAGGCGA